MKRTHLFLVVSLIALVALMAGCSGGFAPTLRSPDGGGGPLPPGCQQVFYTVQDGSGNLITTGTQAQFTFEEKARGADDSTYQAVRQPLCSFSNNTATGVANVVLVLDRSGSMSGQSMTDLKAAAHQFVNQMRAGDHTAIVDFDDVITTTINFTSDKSALNAAIDGIDARGLTAVWDAGLRGLDLANSYSGPGSKTILLMTDGGDNSSTHPHTDVITEATTHGIPVYTVAFGVSADANMQAVATGTGGSFVLASNATELANAFQSIQRSASGSYTVGWLTRFATAAEGTLRITYTAASPPIVVTRDFTVR